MPITRDDTNANGGGDGGENEDDRTGTTDADNDQGDAGGQSEQRSEDRSTQDDEGADADGQDDQDGEDQDGEGSEADGSDADLDGEGDGQPDAGQRRGRENTAIREARRRAQEAERRAADAEARAREAVGNRTSEEQRAFQQRERELVEAMTPEERAQYNNDKRFEQLQQNQRRLELQLRDTADQNSFLSKANNDPRFRNYQTKVEEKLGEIRSRGAWAPRETILATLIGQEILAKGPKAAAKLRKEAGARLREGRNAAPNARGDVTRRGRREPTLEQRLEGVKL